MANPFLMTDDDVGEMATSANEVAFNPFLAQGGEGDTDFTDNPFLGGATNPFAGFGEDETTAPASSLPQISAPQSSDAAMSFFGTTIQEAEDDLSISDHKLPNPLANLEDNVSGYSSEDELARKKAPPRPLPPSQTTQDLIFAVADQLDQASSQMLGRLPKTRSPSPVSMRDLHSPSPIPDALGDFLDCSDPIVQQNPSASVFGDDLMASSDDNPFAAPSVPVMQASQPVVKQPPRPPPPRPVPPRPNPPAAPHAISTTAPPIQHASPSQPQNQEPDLFDMFDARPAPPPKPPAPKTKEDILSLFNAPKPQAQQQQVQPDLLSGDILGDISESSFTLPPPLSEPIIPPGVAGGVTMETNAAFPVGTEVASTAMEAFPTSEPQPTISEPFQEVSAIDAPNCDLQDPMIEQPLIEETLNLEEPQKIIMDSITPDVGCKRAPTPDIEITTVESLPRSDDEEEAQPELEKDVESGIDMDETKSIIAEESDQSPASESNITTQAVRGSPIESNITESINEQEQMDTGLDFVPSVPSGSASANPFASPETEDIYPMIPSQQTTNIFGVEEPVVQSSAFTEPFAIPTSIVPHPATPIPNIFAADDGLAAVASRADEFDAFSAKFDSARKEQTLLEGFGGTTPVSGGDAWGEADSFGGFGGFEPAVITTGGGGGFGGDEEFDSFLAMRAPEQPKVTRKDSMDSLNDEKEFNVVIRPKGEATQGQGQILVPPPPPRSSQNNSIYSGDSSPRFNPFDKGDEVASADGIPSVPEPAAMTRTDSQESPATPLFDDDVSQPLEDFPRIFYTGSGWEMQLRQPNKKKITGQRFWKKIFVKIVFQGDNPVVQLYNQATDKEPFQELPLQPCYSVSEIGAQQYDQFGKIFTIKLQYIFYKERPGVRPGQVTKAERLTNKLSQFAAYAIQGDYQGVKEFGSDLKKLGLPVEHAPQVSQLFKIGSMSFEDMKQFSVCVEEALFKLSAHRDRALNYKSEEVQITAVDELYVEQDAEGHVHKQIARVRLFFLAFLSGMPWIELGVNDLWRQGKEVVGRHDIIPVVTEEWIRLEGVEFHNTVQLDEYERSRIIKFQPPDACYIELMRFRVRPPKNRELPLQVKATWCVTGNRVELRADVLVPGFASRKLGQIPCEDVAIRFPIPECWIYLFRVEKHFRYGSVKSAHRRTGKIKGIERFLGTVDTLQESLIEVTSGQAKYEHHHRAIVWRCPRLPKEGQGAYTTHQMVCRMALTSYDQIPEQLAPYCYVEFTMPATQVSHTTVRSVSVQESDSDEPPEKYVRYLARHEYRVGIEYTTGETQNPYLVATKTTIKEEAPPQQIATSPMAPSDSDSESN